MEIKLAQRLQLGLNIVMTPQLQQAIRLLQLSRTELIDEVQRELEANPVLADEESDPRERNDLTRTDDYQSRHSDQAMSELINQNNDINSRREEKKAQEVDWEQLLENRTLQQPTYATKGGFEELPPVEQSLTRATSLADHLRWQLQMSDFTEAERAFAELVISNLDDNGLLDLKGSYRDDADDLAREVEKDPASKFAVFNVGVMHEKMGDHETARRQFVRFLGDDCPADERPLLNEMLRMVRRCDDGIEELIRDLLALPDSQPWGRELLPGLKAKDARLDGLRRVAGDALRQLLRLMADNEAHDNSGARVTAKQSAEARRMLAQLEATEERLKSLLAAMDGLLGRPRPGPSLPPHLSSLFDRALDQALAARFDDAATLLERITGADVEPQERKRVESYLSHLDEMAAQPPSVRPPARVKTREDGGDDDDDTEAEELAASGTRMTIEQMAERAGLDPEDALEVLRLIQNFDPVGVAARDLRECLRVQAEAYGYDQLERDIIERHLGNLEKHNYQAIARDVKVPLEEVYEACKWIQKLESRPARNFVDTDERSIAITPDVYVVKNPRARLIAEGTGLILLGPDQVELRQVVRNHLPENTPDPEQKLVATGRRLVITEDGVEHDIVIDERIGDVYRRAARLRSPLPSLSSPSTVSWRLYDDWMVLDNDRGLQRLYVNEAFTKKLLHDPNAKEWVGEKLKNAQWLIRAIEQRRKTVIRVTEAIVDSQRDFFEKGVAFLRPMILRDIAEEVRMHESTISRVTTNKYVHSPQGLFELKYFFNSAIKRSDEEDIASESVKQAIKALIEAEDKQNPLSDQAIVEKLEKNNGIKIARRTVAKYREMMGILASSKRKKVF